MTTSSRLLSLITALIAFQIYPVEPRVDFSPSNTNPDPEFPEWQRQQPPMTVEEALYVLGKNFLGRNVTDRLFPIAKQLSVGFNQVGEGLNTIGDLFPSVEFDGSSLSLHAAPTDLEDAAKADDLRGERNVDTQQRITTAPRCTTPTGDTGRCMDIQDCPILIANLDLLRKSICFKSLFTPGVCCPDKGYFKL